MRDIPTFPSFAGGLGAGALLVSAFAAATFLLKTDLVAGWLAREIQGVRTRRNRDRAERLDRSCLDYLDAFRVAGL